MCFIWILHSVAISLHRITEVTTNINKRHDKYNPKNQHVGCPINPHDERTRSPRPRAPRPRDRRDNNRPLQVLLRLQHQEDSEHTGKPGEPPLPLRQLRHRELRHSAHRIKNKMFMAKEHYTVMSPTNDNLMLTIDCDNCVPISLKRYGDNGKEAGTVHRQLSDAERREVMGCTITYGQSPFWYRLIRVLMLSMTKRLYPKQGAPKKPRMNCGEDTEPSASSRNLT